MQLVLFGALLIVLSGALDKYLSCESQKVIGNPISIEDKIYKPLIVQSGIAMIALSDIDMTHATYTAEFYMWFVYEGFKRKIAENIEFTNSIEHFKLKKPCKECEATLISEDVTKGISTIKYRVKAQFRNPSKENYALGKQNLPIKFRHILLGIDKIKYVRDLSDKSNGVFSHSNYETEAERKQSYFEVINDPILMLQDSYSNSTLQSRLELGSKQHHITSLFTVNYEVDHINLSTRGAEQLVNYLVSGVPDKIDTKRMLIYLIFAISIAILLHFVKRIYRNNTQVSYTVWFLKILNTAIILLAIEFLLSQLITNAKSTNFGIGNIDILNKAMLELEFIISLLWWVLPAYYITTAIDTFLWSPIEKKTGVATPKVLRFFVVAIVWVLTVIGVMAYVLEVTTTSLMATSGVFAILFAVMSKIDITNIVAGLGISFSKTIQLNDWVSINGVEGQIVEMSPRAVKLLDFDNTLTSIPNSNVGGATIEVFSAQSFRQSIHLEIVPMDYNFVEKVLLEAALKVKGILETPAPFVAFLGQGDSAQIFEVYFFVDDYANKAYYSQAVWREVWTACENNDIEMSTPQREHFNFQMGQWKLEHK
jgi:branched-chain amino acid transport system substrate-binding protein